MLNHKTIFKQKSKILLTIICIFGLAFSYSCSCRSPEKPPTGGNTFNPDVNPSQSQLSLVVSDDGTAKTTVKIVLYDTEGHNIKNAKTTKIVGPDGTTEIVATYVFSDGSFTISDNDFKTKILDGMSTDSGPAEGDITITMEATTDDSNVTDKTKTFEVKLKLTKAKRFDETGTANIIKEVVNFELLLADNGSAFMGNQDATIEDKKATYNNTKKSENSDQNIKVIIGNIGNEFTANYKTYFDGHTVEDSYLDGTQQTATIKVKFTPKVEYDFTDTSYQLNFVFKTHKWLKD